MQSRCKQFIYGNRQENDKILRICDLIKLENIKFGYKLVNNLLPAKIKQCAACDATGKSPTILKTKPHQTYYSVIVTSI